MAEEYASTRDRDMRLDRSICMYKGEPVYVRTVGYTLTPTQVWAMSLKDNNVSSAIEYTSDDFSYFAFNLGYINYENNAAYLSRRPERRQAQGLVAAAIGVEGALPNGHFFATKNMRNCILGEHPSIKEAYTLIRNEEAISVAFHRYLALQRMDRDRLFLQYRGRTIGWQKDKDSPLFSLFQSKDNAILSPLLKEAGVDYKIE